MRFLLSALLSAVAISSFARRTLEPVHGLMAPAGAFQSRTATPASRCQPIGSETEMAYGIDWLPRSVIADLLALSRVDGLRPEAVRAIVSLVVEYRLEPASVMDVIALGRSGRVSPETVVSAVAAAYAAGVRADDALAILRLAVCGRQLPEPVVDVAVEAAVRGLSPEAVRRIVALVPVEARAWSRFDIVNPSVFSRLWSVKMRARAAAEAGKSTDALWEDYWRILSQERDWK